MLAILVKHHQKRLSNVFESKDVSFLKISFISHIFSQKTVQVLNGRETYLHFTTGSDLYVQGNYYLQMSKLRVLLSADFQAHFIISVCLSVHRGGGGSCRGGRGAPVLVWGISPSPRPGQGTPPSGQDRVPQIGHIPGKIKFPVLQIFSLCFFPEN